MASFSAASFLLLVFCFVYILIPAESRKCTLEKAEIGAKLCHEAMNKTFRESKFKFLKHLEKFGCCLTNGLSSCVEFAFKSSKCSHLTGIMESTIKDKLEHAQRYMDTVAMFISLPSCKSYDKSKCQGLVTNYDAAMKQIAIINGCDWLQPSSILTVFLVLLAYLSS